MEKKIIDRLNDLEFELNDLIEYLTFVDDNFKFDHHSYETWKDRLERLRAEEIKNIEIMKAKQFLKDNGYLVINSEQEINAELLKKWLREGSGPDDKDIPF